MVHAPDRRQTAGAVLRLSFGPLALGFPLRVLSILERMARAVWLSGVALRRVAGAAATVRYLGCRFPAHGAANHHHRATPESGLRHSEVVLIAYDHAA